MIRIIIVALAFTMIIVSALSARASTFEIACYEPTILTKTLQDKYQERPSVYAIAKPETPMVLYKSVVGTWTLVLLLNGKACVLALGTNWVEVLPELNL
jgi:hypothetical protein